MSDWISACVVELSPQLQALKVQLLQCHLLHADESPILVLGSKDQSKRGYLCTYASGAHEPVHAVLFEVNERHSGQHARDFLRHAREHFYARIKILPGQAVAEVFGGGLFCGV